MDCDIYIEVGIRTAQLEADVEFSLGDVRYNDLMSLGEECLFLIHSGVTELIGEIDIQGFLEWKKLNPHGKYDKIDDNGDILYVFPYNETWFEAAKREKTIDDLLES